MGSTVSQTPQKRALMNGKIGLKKSPTAQRAKQKENAEDPKQHGRENENLQDRLGSDGTHQGYFRRKQSMR